MRQVHTRPFFAFEYVNTFCDVNPPFTQNKTLVSLPDIEVWRHILQLTTLGDKIDRARSILTLFGDKIDRLKSFLPFWEAKIAKKCHFYLIFGDKTGRKRCESRQKWKKSRPK